MFVSLPFSPSPWPPLKGGFDRFKHRSARLIRKTLGLGAGKGEGPEANPQPTNYQLRALKPPRGSGAGAASINDGGGATSYDNEDNELYNHAFHFGDELGAGMLVLEVSYIQLQPHKAAAVATAAAAQMKATVGDLEQQRRDLNGAVVTASAVVTGVPDPRVAVAHRVTAGSTGNGGDLTNAAVQPSDSTAPAAASTTKAVGSRRVRLEFGALWPGGPSRAVHRFVARDEKVGRCTEVCRTPPFHLPDIYNT
ncbi:hypothetical protein VaNZ11_007498 [Volvox africanus]|uniref:Uncharacterized protein n=1 Tax=Volvox africanus TaxID=51714 RepID=A0ABQ5S4A9_9CHLO|nr:hypothetical protein VaNZ11_007498 [Volvox africanus]